MAENEQQLDETTALTAPSNEGKELSRTLLIHEGVNYDRRQIRRRVEDRLRERGIDVEQEVVDLEENDDDDASVYEDTEEYSWKQRDAAVHAAAMGGKTEGRLEGFDSLERALQAHEHQIHYGRGRGFGWSSQQKASDELVGDAHKAESMNNLTDWASFRNLEEAAQEREEAGNAEIQQMKKDAKAARVSARNVKMLSTVYILAAIVAVLGFGYFVETVKINSYQTYLPRGFNELGEVEAQPETEEGQPALAP